MRSTVALPKYATTPPGVRIGTATAAADDDYGGDDEQGSRRSQTCYPGRAKIHFPHFSSNFDQFFPTFPHTVLIFFLTFALRMRRVAPGGSHIDLCAAGMCCLLASFFREIW